MEHAMSRQHVVDMCRTMLERGYLKATEGNVSVRIPGRRLYAVTPSNYDYAKMRVEDVCIVDFDGKHRPDASTPLLAPSIEAKMHANVYRVRPDVNAIVHTHQPYASALAFLRREIPALTDEQVRFLGKRVAIIDYAPSGTGFLAKNVREDRWPAATTRSSSPTTASSPSAPTPTGPSSTWRCWRRCRSPTC